MQTGNQRVWLWFFLTNLADQKAILGYPWFTANQPKIDWAWGWIDSSQLPLILHTRKAIESCITQCVITPAGQKGPNQQKPIAPNSIHITQISIPVSSEKKQTLASKLVEQAGSQMGDSKIPAKYHCHLSVFSEEASHWFPEPHIWDHAIKLKPGAPSSIPGKVYQLTQDEQKVLLEFVWEQQVKGYICPSKSPYAVPFFFIKKKDGKLRLVQDYWWLNEWTIKNHYPLPLISELIARIQGAKKFTKVDIRWGYNNIHIKEGDKHKAAFITNQGLFKPTVMFFGLTNSPATFQMMMNAIFTEEIAEGWLIIYMDNILVATKDDQEFHDKCIHWMLDKLKQHDLYLKPEKCIFDQKRIKFLGVILENGTVQMDPAKVKGVADWPPPWNVTDICSFLGFMGFYRYFIPNYLLIAWPMIQLTQKNIPFNWDHSCTHAFEHLKSLMCAKPMLWQPNYTKAFFLATDASTYGMGAILSQEGELNPRTKKPMLCLVAYYSNTFTPTEQNYDIYEWEFLGVLKALKHFRPHVAATEIPVTILTDHTNSMHWKTTRKVNRWVARWFAEIQDYNLVIKHIPGKIHTAPDMLSRPPGADQGKQDNADIVLLPPSMFIATSVVQDDLLWAKVKAAQQKQKGEMEDWCDTQGVRKLPGGYAKEWRLAVPSGLVLWWELMAQFHNSPTAGHPGRDNMLILVSQHYWWPGMNAWIEWYIAGCAQCQQSKIRTMKKKTPLYCIPGDLLMRPFNTITLDLITQLPKANEYDMILTIIDQGCSRATIFIPCRTTITREGIAMLYLKHLFPWFGVPSKVISDWDPHFTSHFAQALMTKLSIGWNISTAFHPQTDGLTERKNQWVEQYLCLYTSARQDDWDVWLPITTFMHNRWLNATTKHSPHELLLGYWPSTAEEPMGIMNNKTVEARHQTIKWHREAALHALNKAVQTIPESQHQVGDWVWLKAKYLALPYTSVKLAPKCHGPFQITKEISPVAYQLTLPRAWTIHNIFHSSLLTPYKETHEHGAQFQHPPPKLIDNEEEYKVEQIINHQYHGKCCQLQYLICWKGYSAADDTWEPADQVHADQLVRDYQARHVREEERNKNRRRTKIRTAIQSPLTCHQLTPWTSLPLCHPASPLTWTLPSPSPSGHTLKPQWSIDRTPSLSQQRSWQCPQSSVSCSSPPIQCALLLKDIGCPEERNSSSSHKDWQELHTKIKKSAATIKNSSRHSNSKEKIWRSAKCMWLTWKPLTNIGRRTWIEGTQHGSERVEGQKAMKKMKDMSLISSSQYLTATIPCMSSPHTSKWTGCTAWAPSALTSPSTNMNFSPHNTSLSKKRGSSPTGSLKALPTALCTWLCTTIPRPRKTGGSQLSSNDTMTRTLKLLPWSQSKGAWLLPSRQLKSSWTKASNACSAPMHMSSTSSSAPSMRAPTSTPSPRGSSPLSPEAHAVVWLDPDQRVMSQGSLPGGKRTAGREEWVHLTPRTGRMV